MENRRGKIFSVEFEFPWLRKPGKFNFADVLLVCLSMYMHKQEICIRIDFPQPYLEWF